MNNSPQEVQREQRTVLGRIGTVAEPKNDRNGKRFVAISLVEPADKRELDPATGEVPADVWHNFNAYGETAIDRYRALLRPGMNVVAVYTATTTENENGEPDTFGRVVRIAPDPVLERVEVAARPKAQRSAEQHLQPAEPAPAQAVAQ